MHLRLESWLGLKILVLGERVEERPTLDVGSIVYVLVKLLPVPLNLGDL